MRTLQTLIVLFATCNCCAPQLAQAAGPPARNHNRATSLVQDVELGPGQTLHIQIVDVQGKPHAGTPIQVRQAGTTLQQTASGNDGRLDLPIKPGTYEISSGNRGGIYRVWKAGTAPPKAPTGILLIDEGGIVRGSRGGWQKAAIVGGVIITSGVLGGVIGYNLKDAS